MIKHARLTRTQKVDIINAYSDDLARMTTLATQYGVSRQAIYKILKRAGADTKKQRLPVSCSTCGTEILRTKGRIRKQLNHFCSEDCYYTFLQGGKPKWFHMTETGNSSRLARSVVSEYFSLQDGHIVHHKNRNRFDNSLINLRVFANQGDHLRHHRGFDVEPIWDGRNP